MLIVLEAQILKILKFGSVFLSFAKLYSLRPLFKISHLLNNHKFL